MSVWLIVLGSCIVFQTIYLIVLYFTLIGKTKTPDKAPSSIFPKVSIVICSKNEEFNLKQHLPKIIEQDYPDVEILIVDDGSTDNTQAVLQTFGNKIKTVFIPSEEKRGLGKKYALLQGIKSANGEIILFTDADCYPASKNWVKEMVAHFNDKTDIVLGIGLYEKRKGLLNKLIAYETAQTALQYLGFAALGNAYMSVGRNVAYSKDLLQQLDWSDKDYAIVSGDDDLAIQQLANKNNVDVCLNPEAFTFSHPKTTWTSWLKQKSRHTQSSWQYKPSHKLLLFLFGFTKMTIWAITLCLLPVDFQNVSSFILLYSLVLLGVYHQLNNHLSLFTRWYFAPITDFILSFSYLFIGIKNTFSSSKTW
ncbi:MAG TPA: glycosyltransferase [Chitinophagales bacterium]|nr:glycosyltransferase [Chitinophagales bacterium]HNL83871.1 glycosyltransferase [Chitinophagales bacterium]